MLFKQLFSSNRFLVTITPDTEGAEMSGTLKNVVALAAGLCDGLGYGSNTKAAIIRQGLTEIRALSKRMYASVRDEVSDHPTSARDRYCLLVPMHVCARGH